MKKLLLRITCVLKGHNWVVFYVHGVKARCKCKRCELEMDNYISDFL